MGKTRPYSINHMPAYNLPDPVEGTMPAKKRDELLEQTVARKVAEGMRVEYKGEQRAVLAYGKRPNHVLHLLLSVITAGLWIPVWIIIAISSKERRQAVNVDKHGEVWVGGG